MKSEISRRFVECLDIMKEEGTVPSGRQFVKSLDYFPQGLSEIVQGNRDVPLEVLRKAVLKYRFNPVYLCTGEGPKFLNEENPTGLQILSIVTDSENTEKIVHVPVPAQAGYVEDLAIPEFVASLPTYNLPDYIFKNATFRSFDVAGDSMHPTLVEGDRVICKFIDPDYWNTDIKENSIYVIVSKEGIAVKRVQNRLRNRNFLRMNSDNAAFEPYKLPADTLVEVWKVEYRLHKMDHLNSMLENEDKPVLNELEMLRSQIKEQNQKIEKLLQALSKVGSRRF